jgi:hypothetical protein
MSAPLKPSHSFEIASVSARRGNVAFKQCNGGGGGDGATYGEQNITKTQISNARYDRSNSAGHSTHW